MEDLVIVESKDYAQVVFEDVRECYAEGQTLECLFNLNELLKASETDWIGIYKVGFANYKDFSCIKHIDLQLINKNKGKILFEEEQIPKDDGEFYQFVYVSHSKQIRGASIPFQFKRSHLSDYVEIEDHEAIVYKSKESAINDTIIEIKSRCNQLTQANETYEKLIKENETTIHILKDEIASVKLRCMRLTMDNEKLNFTLKSKAEYLKALTDTISDLNSEKTNMQARFESIMAENKSLHGSLQEQVNHVAKLKTDMEAVKLNKVELESLVKTKENELQELKKEKLDLNRIADDLKHINEQISNLEKQVNERVDELNMIKMDLKRNETLVTEQAETIQNILSERDALNDLIKKLSKEKADLESSQEAMSQELSMSRDKLLAAEQCKEMLRAQVVVLTNELNASNAKIETYLAKLSEMAAKEKHSDIDKDELGERVRKMKQEYDMKLDEASGSYFALKMAHTHLESKLKALEQANREKHAKDVDYYKENMEKLRHENSELKDRIKAGAKEYSKLMDKYHFIKNKQFNADMNIYHDLSGDSQTRRSELFSLNNRFGMTSSQINPILLNRQRPSTNEQETDTDSAIQGDKTISQSQHMSTSAEIENTLLDALLSTSLYAWKGSNSKSNNNELSTSPSQTSPSTITTSQPRMMSLPRVQSGDIGNNDIYQQVSDMSDDGLIHSCSKNKNNGCSSELRFRAKIAPATEQSQIIEDVDQEVDKKKAPEVYNLFRQFQLRANTSEMPLQKPINFDGNSARICDICNYIFPTDSNLNEIEKHYALHYGPSCPICFLTFRKGFPQSEFENHVNAHFNNS